MKIGTSKPVNKLAALVTSKGYEYQPNKEIVNLHWELKPQLRSVPKNTPNLIGFKFGHLVESEDLLLRLDGILCWCPGNIYENPELLGGEK